MSARKGLLFMDIIDHKEDCQLGVTGVSDGRTGIFPIPKRISRSYALEEALAAPAIDSREIRKKSLESRGSRLHTEWQPEESAAPDSTSYAMTTTSASGSWPDHRVPGWWHGGE
jgi:hypothetical protein